MKSTLDVLMGRLRMKQLQLLMALDDHKSLHKAAGAMAMTQSAASKALSELELMLDAPLFERKNSGMVPNAFGQCVIRYARLLTADLTSLCREVADIRTGTGGRLAVGAIMGAIPEVVVPLLNALQRKHPGVSIDIVEATSTDMLTLLDDGKLDLVIGRTPVSSDPAPYRYESLGEEPLALVVGAAHPPISKKRLALAEFAHYRWVTYPNSLPMQAFIAREMELAGVALPASAIATASTFVTVSLLQHSADMTAVLPLSVATLFASHRMVQIVPVQWQTQPRTFGIVTRKGAALGPLATQFMQMCREACSDGAISTADPI